MKKIIFSFCILFSMCIQANIKKSEKITDAELETIVTEETTDEFFVIVVDDALYTDYSGEKEKLFQIEETSDQVNYTIYEMDNDPYSVMVNNFRELDEEFIISSKMFEMFDTNELFPRFNKFSYSLTATLDKKIGKPVSAVYGYIVPKPVRKGIANFFDNFNEIPSTVNSVIQLKPKKALTSLGRFAINSTIGLGGVFDVATHFGLKKDRETFGDTLGHYGMPPGGYLFIPIMGPTTLRDGLGGLVDQAMVSYGIKNPLYNELFIKPGILSSPGLIFGGVDLLNQRSMTHMGYGDLDSPFEYDIIQLVFKNARNIQISK